jgi:hypothetical protein
LKGKPNMTNEQTMKRWTLLAVALGLLLSLLVGDAMAAPGLKGPGVMAGKGQPKLWTNRDKLVANASFKDGTLKLWIIKVSWPEAVGADHYRMTALSGAGEQATTWRDLSPVDYDVDPSTGKAYYIFYAAYPRTFTFTFLVTAYASPDEETAYSETLQTQIKVRAKS